MSTLGRILRLDERDREYFYPRQPFKITEVFNPDVVSINMERVTRYQLNATFKATVTIRDADYHAGTTSATIDRAKREVVEAVYGEYFNPLFDAVRQIDNYEPEKARDIILKVLDNMRSFEPMKPNAEAP